MLGDLALWYVSQSEEVLRALSYGLMILGALIGGATNSDKSEIQRAPYFVYTGLLVLAAASIKSVWILAIAAMAGGYLWVLVLVDIAWSCIAGFILCRIAMARSRDAYGSSGRAFLAFIPLANLWLLLKESKSAVSVKRTSALPAISGGAGVLVGFALFFGAGVVSSLVQQRLNDLSQEGLNQPASMGELVESMVRSQGLERTLRVMITDVRTPIKVDEITTLESVAATGVELRRTYSVAADMSFVSDDLHFRSTNGICAYEPFIPVLRAGATINEIYVNRSGHVMGTVSVTAHECGF